MIEQLNKDIELICNKLIDEAGFIAKLDPVSHLSKSKIQFSGGILGGIQEFRESKRLIKLMNEVICNEWSFYSYAGHLLDVTTELVEKQIEVQNNCQETDDCYYGNVTLIVNSVALAHKAWYEYSPDMAMAGIRIGDEDNVSLELSIDSMIKNEFRKLHLPNGMSFPEEKETSNSGCLGLLLIIIVPTIIALIV